MGTPVATSQGLSDADNFTIIEEINNRSLLWDPANKDHKNSRKVAEKWAEIADLLSNSDRQISAEAVIKRFENLKDSYTRKKRKASQSGASGKNKPEWKYYSKLSFLDSTTSDPNVRVSNLKPVPTEFVAEYIDPEEIEIEFGVMLPTSSAASSSVPTSSKSPNTPNFCPKKRKKTSETEEDPLERAFIESIRPQDEASTLGDLVAHMHRRLVAEGYLRASRDLKRNIQDNVNHYEDWLLNQYENEHQGNIDIE